MPAPPKINAKAPLLCWDFFCGQYNSLIEHATKYQQSVAAIKKIAKENKWDKQQMLEAIENMHQYVVIVTDHSQQISFTGRGFEEMTGYTFEEARGKNPKFLQGPATDKSKTGIVKYRLDQNETTETVLENYRKNGELYLCKIIIKPVFNIQRKLVNFIAYEKEIAA